jgi:O-antigen ligase
MTKSWGGLLGALLCGALVVIKKWNLAKLVMIAILLITVVSLYFRDYRSQLAPLQVVAESRTRILMKGLIAVIQRPLVGWGWTQFLVAFKQIDWPEHYLIEANVDRAHSSILEMGVSGGIVALITYLAILGISICKLMKSKHPFAKTMGVMLIVYLVHSQTNVTSVAEELFMWFGVGMATKFSQELV